MTGALATVTCALMAFGIVEGQAQGRYCGPALTAALSLACDSIYNQKRTMNTVYLEPDEEDNASDLNRVDVRDLFLERTDATAMMKKRNSRFRQYGVVDECCRKSCTIHELKSYCG